MLKVTGIWTLIGLVCVVSTGMIIFTTDPLSYYYNWSFRYKMLALLIAIIFNYTIHRKVAMSNSTGGASILTGAVSLLLWMSIVFAGIFYAFTEELHYVGGPN